jgi:hypothetical protein
MIQNVQKSLSFPYEQTEKDTRKDNSLKKKYLVINLMKENKDLFNGN